MLGISNCFAADQLLIPGQFHPILCGNLTPIFAALIIYGILYPISITTGLNVTNRATNLAVKGQGVGLPWHYCYCLINPAVTVRCLHLVNANFLGRFSIFD